MGLMMTWEVIVLGYKFSEVTEGSYLILQISNNDKSMVMGAILRKTLASNVAVIELDYETAKRLNFSNVFINMECTLEGGIPVIWRNVKISYLQNHYVLQVFGEGAKHNRRNSFRVLVGIPARVQALGTGPKQVIVRDVSLSGFAITDRKKELNYSVGDTLRICFEDIGHHLDLEGKVVRIEEHPDMNIYGFSLCNLCKDLSSYVSVKQRRNKG